jgi:hypothetical protein
MKPVIGQEIVDACRMELESVLQPYEDLQNLELLKANWDITRRENQICVEDLFVRVFTCMFVIAIRGSILENKENQGRKSMEAITKGTLENVFEKILPWFILFKILQRNKPKYERVTFKTLRNMFKDFFKMLNILHCILTFGEVKFTRKTTWTNFHGKQSFFINIMLRSSPKSCHS